jgi:hypothetical protein
VEKTEIDFGEQRSAEIQASGWSIVDNQLHILHTPKHQTLCTTVSVEMGSTIRERQILEYECRNNDGSSKKKDGNEKARLHEEETKS